MEPQFIQDYVATGKVLFEFKDLAFLGDESTQAAEAAGCALDQGKYWQYYDTLFANQSGENKGAFTTARLEEMARLIGLNPQTFNSCLTSGKYKAEVQASEQQAQKDGITQTPTLIVNGQNINYSGNYSELKAAIDKALQQ